MASIVAGLLGCSLLITGDTYLYPLFLIVAYVALALSLVVCYRACHDLVAPIFLVVLVTFVRYCVPAFAAYAYNLRHIPLFQVLVISQTDLDRGHTLALTCLVFVSLGWLAAPEHQTGHSLTARTPNDRLWVGAVLGMTVGYLFLLLFVATNTSLSSAVLHGTFRGVAVHPGTGKYFYLGLVLIPGSTAACAVLLRRDFTVLAALVPAFLASWSFLVLGGRARAATPLLCGLVLVWYCRGPWPRRLRSRHAFLAVLGGAAAVVVMLWALYAGQAYRGGDLNRATSLRQFANYARITALTDIGQTQSLALAVDHAGALHGRTFAGALLWPLSKLLPIPSRSTGIYLVQSTRKYKTTWGLLPSLAGDAYVNFGVAGILVVSFLFGFLIKLLYGHRRKIPDVLYAVLLVYVVRVYTESLDKWGELLVVAVYTILLLHLPRVEELVRLRPRSTA
jgi:oligosaccharide repeat unit polymerase